MYKTSELLFVINWIRIYCLINNVFHSQFCQKFGRATLRIPGCNCSRTLPITWEQPSRWLKRPSVDQNRYKSRQKEKESKESHLSVCNNNSYKHQDWIYTWLRAFLHLVEMNILLFYMGILRWVVSLQQKTTKSNTGQSICNLCNIS